MIDAEMAREVAKNYCEANGLSVPNLFSEKRFCASEKMYFLRFPDAESHGLKNDLETQGFPILIVNEDYSVSETEHTREYLL